jgi:hypothetical protein
MSISLSTIVNQVNPLQLAKAWVNFNGTTATPSTIRSSYNVSSITRNATGDFTVNFATALADADYSVCVTGQGGASYNSIGVIKFSATPSLSTANVRVNFIDTSAALNNPVVGCVQIFGN